MLRQPVSTIGLWAALFLLLDGFHGEARAAESRGERALKVSFYLNTVPAMVEMVDGMKKDMLDAFELDGPRRAAAEKALATFWTEKRIYANAALALDKQMSPEALDAAMAQMTPEVQAMIKAGISEPSVEQAKAWLAEAQKRPDAKVREGLARRLAAHLPQADVFKELVGQVIEVMADIAQATTGNDQLRSQLRDQFMEGLAPALVAMKQKETMVNATIIAYHAQPTEKLKMFADAMDSEAAAKLQGAAVQSLIAGARQTRQELVAQLQKDLKPGKKK